MKKLILIGLMIMVGIAGCTQEVWQKGGLKANELCFENGKCISIEYAITPEERARGLMHREMLPENAGMLFVFPEETMPGFWMKNVKFPLDFVWIGKDMRIAGFEENVPVCSTYCPSYSSENKILYVLEVNKGFVTENMLKIGQKADFLVINNK